MIVSLIGMSGTGKTHWSEKLEREMGFQRICCDDEIELCLGDELKSCGAQDVSDWMGLPTESSSFPRQARYLEEEENILREILQKIETGKLDLLENTVVDTTGSFVHLPEKLCSGLKKNSTIVYLESPESAVDELLAQYLRAPRPIVWGNFFSPLPGEEQQETMHRCYRALLRHRIELYKEYADIIIPYKQHRQINITTQELLEQISSL